MGNRWDPATRYEGAQIVRELLPNSALLTLEMPAHTSIGLSPCVDQAVGQYLLDPTVATQIDGAVCPPSFDPFLLGPPPAARSAAEPEIVPEVRDLVPVPAGNPWR